MKKSKYNIYGYFRNYINDTEFTEEKTREIDGYIFTDNGIWYGITNISSMDGKTKTAYYTVTELYTGFKIVEGKYKASRKATAEQAIEIFRKVGAKHCIATMGKYNITTSVNPGIIKECPYIKESIK